jgi:hypothetical protein
MDSAGGTAWRTLAIYFGGFVEAASRHAKGYPDFVTRFTRRSSFFAGLAGLKSGNAEASKESVLIL